MSKGKGVVDEGEPPYLFDEGEEVLHDSLEHVRVHALGGGETTQHVGDDVID